MSVIVALISDRNGTVATDGRLFRPARFANDKVVEPATIESDDFNKTFALTDGRIIGAVSGGVLRFSGNTVSGHISDILATPLLNAAECTLASLATELQAGLSKRLTNIDEEEVMFRYRDLAILFVGGAALTRFDMQIIQIEFWPEGKSITVRSSTFFANNRKRHCAKGDPKAAGTAHRVIASNRAPNKDPAFLKKLASNAVRMGIKASGTHQYGNELACGGTLFVRETSYE